MRHRRQPGGTPVRGRWKLGCACGWIGHCSAALRHAAASDDLNRQFVAHLPEGERQIYVLVDRRLTVVPGEGEGEDDPGLELPVGNMIMPQGVGCTVLGWWEDDGMYYARVQGFGYGDPVIELPVGEIRLEDGRVFRTE